jgi:DNA-binding MarR family transcriptional regulator
MKKLLSQKDLTAIEKLILIDMKLFPEILIYNKMSAEIAASIGVKQKDVKIALNTLEEKGVIKTSVGYRTRSTELTNDFKNILKND